MDQSSEKVKSGITSSCYESFPKREVKFTADKNGCIFDENGNLVGRVTKVYSGKIIAEAIKPNQYGKGQD